MEDSDDAFVNFLWISIFLVLCEFLTILKVFRCYEKLRISSFTFFEISLLLLTQEFVADTDSHGYIGISRFGGILLFFDDFDFTNVLFSASS